jgi:hypothetical protein
VIDIVPPRKGRDHEEGLPRAITTATQHGASERNAALTGACQRVRARWQGIERRSVDQRRIDMVVPTV